MKRLLLALACLALVGAAPIAETLVSSQGVAGQEQRQIALADLAAQQRMAASAEWMTAAAIAQLLVGAITLTALIAAYVISRDTLNAAREQLENERQSVRRQLQPYPGVASFKCEFRDRVWEMAWQIKNYGDTPMRNIRQRYSLQLEDGKVSLVRHDFSDDEPWTDVADLAPGQSAAMGIDMRLDGDMRLNLAEALGDVFDERRKIVLFLEWSFTDTFGEDHTFYFSEFRYGPDLTKSDHNMGFMGGRGQMNAA